MILSLELIECLFPFAHQFDLIYIFNSPCRFSIREENVSKSYHFSLLIIKMEVLNGFITRIINNWKASISFHFPLLLFVSLFGFSSFMSRKAFLKLTTNQRLLENFIICSTVNKFILASVREIQLDGLTQFDWSGGKKNDKIYFDTFWSCASHNS